jgi:N-methylhydantoinase B
MGNSIGIRTKGEWSDELPNAKVFGVRIRKGDAYVMRSGGGGGFGTPLQRDPELVLADVSQGYVSREAARESYGVVIGEDGALDAAATIDLRRRMLSSAA